ncbi:MAG: hypothetical protein K6F89_01500 [Prevotella sp.]|nr:hypothetical protein [Prevotella sp.]
MTAMSFAIICISSIIVLGIVAAIFSWGDKDEPIVPANDCASCSSMADGSCKIACLMEEKRKKEKAAEDEK